MWFGYTTGPKDTSTYIQLPAVENSIQRYILRAMDKATKEGNLKNPKWAVVLPVERIESDSDDSSFDGFLKPHKTPKRRKSNEGIGINIKKEKEKGKSEEVKKSTKIKQEQGLKNIIKKEYQELKHNQKNEKNLSEDKKDQ